MTTLREAPMTITPYPEPDGQGHTSGWSGSATSHERALREDADGTTGARQRAVLGCAEVLGAHGLTVKDLREITDMHHGQASSALSTLHHDGRLARLTERRDRCAVYVLPENVNGRETAPHGRRRPGLTDAERLTLSAVEDDMAQGYTPLRSRVAVLVTALRRLSDG